MLAKTILTTLHSKATSYTENQYKFIYSISCLTLLFLSNIMYLFNQGSILTFGKFFSSLFDQKLEYNINPVLRYVCLQNLSKTLFHFLSILRKLRCGVVYTWRNLKMDELSTYGEFFKNYKIHKIHGISNIWNLSIVRILQHRDFRSIIIGR